MSAFTPKSGVNGTQYTVEKSEGVNNWEKDVKKLLKALVKANTSVSGTDTTKDQNHMYVKTKTYSTKKGEKPKEITRFMEWTPSANGEGGVLKVRKTGKLNADSVKIKDNTDASVDTLVTFMAQTFSSPLKSHYSVPGRFREVSQLIKSGHRFLKVFLFIKSKNEQS